MCNYIPKKIMDVNAYPWHNLNYYVLIKGAPNMDK